MHHTICVKPSAGSLRTWPTGWRTRRRPYLLQHKDNPVDWYPWGEEALRARVKRSGRYCSRSATRRATGATSWSASRSRIRDRRAHERALRLRSRSIARSGRTSTRSTWRRCQAMTGHGGWPLNVFLTPSRCRSSPAPTSRPSRAMGMPSFRAVLERGRGGMGRAQRDEIRAGGAPDRRATRAAARCWSRRSDDLDRGTLDAAVETLAHEVRRAQRRLRRRAEVPAGVGARVPARAAASTEMTLDTLRAMARGGIYDQVGGGFARYSVDAHWLVPHFEKMLYDNALLARAYLHGWQVTGEPLLPHGRRGDARLGAARDARPRGRLLLRARRGLRGRGGQVLRLDAWRSCARRSGRARRRRGDRVVRRHRRAATSRAGTSRCAARASRSGASAWRERLYDVRAAARVARPRRQAAHLLERADDLRAGRRRRGTRARRLPGRRRAGAEFVLRDAARPRGPAAPHLEGRAGGS